MDRKMFGLDVNVFNCTHGFSRAMGAGKMERPPMVSDISPRFRVRADLASPALGEAAD